MINKPTLQEVFTCLNVIGYAIDELDVQAKDSVVTLYKVLSDKESELKNMESHLAAVIQAGLQDTKKPELKEDNKVNFDND